MKRDIDGVPDGLLDALAEFIQRLKSIHLEVHLSEPKLAEDWLRPEEGQTWASLFEVVNIYRYASSLDLNQASLPVLLIEDGHRQKVDRSRHKVADATGDRPEKAGESRQDQHP